MLFTRKELNLSLYVLSVGTNRNHEGKYFQKEYPLHQQKTASELYELVFDQVQELADLSMEDTEDQEYELELTTKMKSLLIECLDRELNIMDSKVAIPLREKLDRPGKNKEKKKK